MTTALHTRVAWQTPLPTVWSQSTVLIHTSTAGVLDLHKDLNQQKMGIPPMTLKIQCLDSQEARDLVKSKKERDCGFFGWIFFGFWRNSFFTWWGTLQQKKKYNISFINTMKWHSLEMALTHICLTKNIWFFHAHLLQNSHIKTELSFQMLGIWHKFSFQLVGICYTLSFLSVGNVANTVDSTPGFFFPALSLTVNFILLYFFS